MGSKIQNGDFLEDVFTRQTDFTFQDYRVFGLRPLSGVVKNTKEHNVLETVSVSVLK
jgi:hypothetical protein